MVLVFGFSGGMSWLLLGRVKRFGFVTSSLLGDGLPELAVGVDVEKGQSQPETDRAPSRVHGVDVRRVGGRLVALTRELLLEAGEPRPQLVEFLLRRRGWPPIVGHTLGPASTVHTPVSGFHSLCSAMGVVRPTQMITAIPASSG
jgi:hypothetical protein